MVEENDKLLFRLSAEELNGFGVKFGKELLVNDEWCVMPGDKLFSLLNILLKAGSSLLIPSS